ncbi:MAG: hypothetical protein SFV51_17170, partial [Bryobacteraceae bacterium]|nr:hypothetical protein [Bryobacteraceae bacterium]
MIRSWAVRILTAGFCTGLALAAPQIRGGAVNAASRIVPGLPDYGVAKGSLMYLGGQGMGPDEIVRGEFPLGEELGGVKVSVRVGDSTVNAIMVAVSARQVWAIVPSSAPSGSGVVTLTYNGENATTPIDVVDAAFGIFVTPGATFGNAIGFNGGQELNQFVKSARPGQQVTLIGTGLGA